MRRLPDGCGLVVVHSLGGGAMIPVRRADDERGVILVFTAIFLVVALGILAIVIDLGNAHDERRQAQVGADAAALAGAETIEAFGDNFTGTADQWQSIVDQVKAYAKENFEHARERVEWMHRFLRVELQAGLG